jgi:hypothetical protein
MNNSPTRFLRPTPTGFDVYIEDPVFTPDPEDPYPAPRTVGKRTPGEPVATIVRFADDSYQLRSADGRSLATGKDPKGLAYRLAGGSFDYDFRFEVTTNPEPDSPSDLFFIQEIGVPSQMVHDSWTTGEPYEYIAAARERQAVPDLEDRLELYAERGW